MDTPDNFRLAFRLNTLFFPADLNDLAIELTSRGYRLMGQMRPTRPVPVTLLGGTLDPMAVKERVLFDVNTDRAVVGVTAPTINAVVDAMTEIAQLFEERFHVQKADYKFFEFSGQLHRKAETSPILALDKVADSTDYIKKFGKILNSELSIRSIRLAPKNTPFESLDYFDITIEPELIASTKMFVASVIYRKKDLQRLINTINVIDKRIEDMINFIQTAG